MHLHLLLLCFLILCRCCYCSQPGFEDPNALKTPIVRYCAVSSIEHGHKAPITDIQWMPDHMLVSYND